MSRSPLVVIPGRLAASTSALRFAAVVTAQALSSAVLRAGGEPLTVQPWAPDGDADPVEVGERLAFADAVLLPGGGDIAPRRYGQDVGSDHVYDVDDVQDAFDLAVARWALERGVPLLAVCRGMQVVTVALGGQLEQHMDRPHRPLLHDVDVESGSRLADVVGERVRVSCFHHQQVSRLGAGMREVARSAEGCIEAVDVVDTTGWFLGVQWHPEDTAATDPSQQALVDALVAAAR